MIEQFFRPDSVEQALELKRRYQDEAVWFAGGSKLNATPTRTDKKIAISLQDLELDWIDWITVHYELAQCLACSTA
ncbi:putative FAD binding molybdopterin dehydrogenase [Escherichia coli]|uniref:Putative FAD binding molybdopterin dehydrogenase n=1 Tax=Escherichia coli TaxID=562 RepID=A0A484YWU7_ECOLX|nr:putative FAD binding molybdopterin dehydrogenase [Escherichia coli]